MLALITGASEGLGEALSYALCQKGTHLILVARNEEKLQILASILQVPVQVVVCDLCNPKDRSKLISLIHEKKPDLIINNAGCGLYGPALSHSTPDSLQMIQLNIEALVELSLEGTKALLSSGKKGTIMNISSAAAFHPYPTLCIYAATKAFVNSFSQGLDEEMRASGIRVLTVCPGQIDTHFRDKAGKGTPQIKNNFTMSSEKAAKLILQQIERRSSLRIIDWKYRLGIYLSKWFPRSWVTKALRRGLRNRY